MESNWRDDIIAPALAMKRGRPLQHAIQAFLADLTYIRGCTANTLAAYETDLRQFMKVLSRGKSRLADLPPELTSSDVEEYVAWLKAKGYQASTVARKMASVRSFIKFLEPKGGRHTEYLLARLKPPVPPSRRTRTLTREEVARLLAAPAERGRVKDLRDSAILSLLYAAGLKAAEAVELTVADLDLFRGVLRSGPGRSERRLGGAAQPLRLYLQLGRPQLLAGRDDTHALFLNLRGGSLSRQGLWLVVKRWARNVGLGDTVSPHTLRRSRAAHMLEDGQRKRDVQQFLGLSSPNTLGPKNLGVSSGEEEPEHDR
jgi:integrase/recombinase XerD